jgi:hypothetical protein
MLKQEKKGLSPKINNSRPSVCATLYPPLKSEVLANVALISKVK